MEIIYLIGLGLLSALVYLIAHLFVDAMRRRKEKEQKKERQYKIMKAIAMRHQD